MSLASCGKEIVCRQKAKSLSRTLINYFNQLPELDNANVSESDYVNYSISKAEAVIPLLEQAIQAIAE